jgi:hypothetical protein
MAIEPGLDPTQAERIKTAVLEQLEADYDPPGWLTNGHAQTIFPRFFRPTPDVSFRTEQWDTPDDDFLNLHFLDGDPAKPTVLLLHGLEGCSRSHYILGISHALHREGWNIAVMEFRSCGGTMNRAKRLYHAGETTDLAFVVEALAKRNPNLCLYAVGFSLGGNVLAKWLGECGDAAPSCLRGAAVVSPPFDMAASGAHLDDRIGRMYTKHFLRMLIPKVLAKEVQYPGTFDIDKVRSSRTFWDFDTHATAVLHGFENADQYWARSSCGQYLPEVRRPLIVVASETDPLNPASTLPRDAADESPWLIPKFVRHGGHAAFVHGPTPWEKGSWAEDQIVRGFLALEDME